MNRVAIPTKRQGETVFCPPTGFNFISNLAAGETIATQVVTASVYTGVDANPANIISGAASVSGTSVMQLITGGVLGVIYELLCTITTSAGQTLEMAGYLAVIPDLP
jgi:hypothetical protein